MRNRIIAFFSVIVVIVAAIIGFHVYRNSQNQSESTSNPTNSSSSTNVKKNGKVLVVYLSRTKGVYGGGLTRGNTARVADSIQEKTKGDTYEIIPKWHKVNKSKMLVPAIKNALPNVKKYQTVFIGVPIWWGEYPMIVRTFIDNVNLNGKTVIPFTTAEGSGLGNTTD